MILILAVSSIPRLRAPGPWRFSDKIAHIVEYGGLGGLLTWAGRPRSARTCLGWIVLGAAIGAADELYQKSVPGRFSSSTDWLADLVGVSAGACLLCRGLFARSNAAGRKAGGSR